MAKRIGITGNIGAGKTTVCRIFERFGVPVYYADERAKTLMHTDPTLGESVRSHFGSGSYHPDGQLNRGYLSERVFGDSAALELLNSLVHPAVAEDAIRWHREQRDTPYTLHEAAILLEIGAGQAYEAIVVVSCPEDLRRQRVVARDRITDRAFMERAARQWDDARKEAAADHLIVNDGRRLLLPQVLRVDQILRTGAAPKTSIER